jgi:phosphate-selective porin OprO/OprP
MRTPRLHSGSRNLHRAIVAVALLVALLAAVPAWCQNETEESDKPPQGEETKPPTQDAPPAQQAPADQTAASGSFMDRTRTIGDALRGMATWDLFKGRVTLRVYTRFQLDGTLSRGDGEIDQNFGSIDDNRLDIRRLNLYAAGTINGHLDYEVGYLFGPDASIWNAFVQGMGEERGLNVFGFHVGNFRFGYFQEPFSVERITSSYYTGFAERSLPVWTFAPGNNIGYMVFNDALNGRLSWAFGIFSFGQSTELNPATSSLSADLKLTGRPIYRDEGRHLLHVGLAYSNRQPTGDTMRFRVRPEARFVDFFADTGDIPAATNRLYQAEAAWVEGPIWAQSEIIVSDVSGSVSSLRFKGSYVQAGVFLTGEVRPFNTLEGYFGRVIPKRKTALELVARLSAIDLNDGDVYGGQFKDLGFGANFYIGSTSRLMGEYIRSRVQGSGKANIVIVRMAWRPRSR